MKTINVELTGTSPLLMNSPKGMLEVATGEMKNRTEKYEPIIEAEKVAYRTKKGKLYVPCEAIKGTLVGAASYKKIGKYSARPMIAGGVFISPIEIELDNKDYEIDLRTVVIQRSRVVKARPRLDKWKLNFDLTYNEKLIGSSEIIKAILVEAGERVGLLDFRPQKLGSFGMFRVSKWVEAK